MNIYLLTQTEIGGYDTYDSCVVCAENEEAASKILPSQHSSWEREPWRMWASRPENVTVKLIGVAADGVEPGVVLASFNAG